MKKFKIKNSSRGFMMIEVVVASSIIAVAVLATMAVAEKSIRVSVQGVHTAEASFLLEEGAEAVRILRDNGWSNISALSPATAYYPLFSDGTWRLSSARSQVG